MIIYVDIDGTICDTHGNDYENAVPDFDSIRKVNELFDIGNTVIYWTARGCISGKDWYSFTLSQLVGWGCKFNSLITSGKPYYDLFIDDKSKRIEEL